MPPPDVTFMLWASAYVILKWTAGLWLVRKLHASHVVLTAMTRVRLRRLR